MPEDITSDECSLCLRIDVCIARYCVYCVSLIICAECRRQLRDQENCPQCRRAGLGRTPPDMLITGSRPKPRVATPTHHDFHWTPIGTHGSRRQHLHIRIGTKRRAGTKAYARLDTSRTKLHLVFANRTGAEKTLPCELALVDSKASLLRLVCLVPAIQYQSWSALVKLLEYGPHKESRDKASNSQQTAIVLPAEESRERSTSGSASNPITL